MDLVLPSGPDWDRLRPEFTSVVPEVVPHGVARCSSPSDVAEALAYARARGLPIAVRGGMHSFAGWSTTPGLVVDVSPMSAVTVDGDLVHVGPGVRLGELAERLAKAGRALSCGWYPAVSIGGSVQGGGYGPLSRLHGLAADHLVSASVVLASGVACEAPADLLWALRGSGGGRYCVLTALTLRTEPARPVVHSWHRWPWSSAPALVEAWQAYAPDLPDAMTYELSLDAFEDPAEPPYAALYGASTLSRTGTESMLAPLLAAVGPPPEQAVDELDALEAAYWCPGPASPCHDYPTRPRRPVTTPWFRRSTSSFHTGPIRVDALLDHLAADRVHGEHRDLNFVPWGGALSRPSSDACFPHRTPRWLLKHTVSAVPGHSDDSIPWLRASAALVEPHATGAVYPNFPDPDLPVWSPAYHGPSTTRLHELKQAYDPEGLFLGLP